MDAPACVNDKGDDSDEEEPVEVKVRGKGFIDESLGHAVAGDGKEDDGDEHYPGCYAIDFDYFRSEVAFLRFLLFVCHSDRRVAFCV